MVIMKLTIKNLTNLLTLLGNKQEYSTAIQLEALLGKDYCFTKETLANFLEEIEQVASQVSSPLLIVITSMTHSISLKYNTQKSCWALLCVEKEVNETTIKELPRSSLVVSLFESLKTISHAVFNFSLYSMHPDENLKEKLKAIDLKYPICIEQMALDDNQVDLMQFALEYNHVKVIEELLKLDTDFNKLDIYGYSYFFIACTFGLTEIVKVFLKSQKVDVNQCNKEGLSPLGMACLQGHKEVVLKLLKAKNQVNLNALYQDGSTLLHLACQRGDPQIVQELLKPEYHLDINKTRNNGIVPLFQACANNGNLEVIRIILSDSSFKNIDAIGINGNTPLLIACSVEATKGKEFLFLELLEHGANLAHKNSQDETAFDLAFARNNETALREILQWANKMQMGPLSIMSLETLYELKHTEVNKRSNELTIYLETLGKQTILKLTHTDIHAFGTLLGYKKFKKGICGGFTGMLIQAALSDDKPSVYQRLSFIASYDNNLSKIVEEIKQVQQKKYQDLDTREIHLLNLLPYYDGMQLYHNPEGNSPYFLGENRVSQLDHSIIFTLVKSLYLNKNKLGQLLDKDYCFTKEALFKYLEDLEQVLNQVSYPLPISLGSFNHKVYLEYDKQIAKWEYVDTNDFKRYLGEESYVRVLDTKALVSSLFESFKTTSYVVFNTNIDSIYQDEDFKAKFNAFDKKYPIGQEQTNHDDNQYNLLHFACRSGNMDRVKALLKLKMDVHEKNKKGDSSIEIVYSQKHLPIIQELLKPEYNIDFNKPLKKGATIFYLACQHGLFDIVKELLKPHYKVDFNKQTQAGETAFFVACGFNHVEIVKELLKPEYKVEINKSKECDITPFHIACAQGYIEITKELLKSEHQVDCNAMTQKGETGFFMACSLNRIEIVKELIKPEFNIEINKARKNGVTPLYIACQMGHLEIVKEILSASHFVNIDALGITGHTALLVACLVPETLGKASLFLELLKNGANIEHKNDEKQTAFDIAFTKGNETAIRELVQWAKMKRLTPWSIMSLETYNQLKNSELIGKIIDITEYLQEINSDGAHQPIQNPNHFFKRIESVNIEVNHSRSYNLS